MSYVLTFGVGIFVGWYFSVMIDDRLTPQGDE
jgi:hypothetical protein